MFFLPDEKDVTAKDWIHAVNELAVYCWFKRGDKVMKARIGGIEISRLTNKNLDEYLKDALENAQEYDL